MKSQRPPDEVLSADRTLIDQLLDEQRQLTAVEMFARAHDAHAVGTPHYRALLPTASPAPGQQYAFEVNLDQCSGCKACVAACHSLNGLDDGEAWRDVGQLISDDWRRPFQQTITTACHHCADPGCLNGCPVLAYEKDAVTGIVRHLDDQCIGCQYCVMKCPYEVPKYSAARGIVRKCDMCSQRLGVGEAPACVQACPNEAIRITIADQGVVEAGSPITPVPTWLPAAPDPAITLPTTRYVSKKPLAPDLIPPDAATVPLQPAHWPLVWMLTLTQMSVGGFAVATLMPGTSQVRCLGAALAAGWVGLAASTLHLGKPLKAWRSFLGLRRSWLSREIVIFGGFAPLAATTTALTWVGAPVSWRFGVLWLTVATGLIGVFCSAMIYHDTRRVFWRATDSVPKFLLTAGVLGLATAWAMTAVGDNSISGIAPVLAFAVVLKLALEHRALRRGDSGFADVTWPKPADFNDWSLAKSARLLREELGLVTRWRFFCGIIGGVFLPLASLLPGVGSTVLSFAALALCVAGEVMERYTFFRAVVPPRMPGGV